jgi:hypothetical protein
MLFCRTNRPHLREAAVSQIYDVFRKFPYGQVWVEAVEGLENVGTQVMKRMKAEPGEYYVYDLVNKTVVLQLCGDDKNRRRSNVFE